MFKIISPYGFPVRIPPQYIELRDYVGMGLRELDLMEKPPTVPDNLLQNKDCINQRIKLNLSSQALYRKLRPNFKSDKNLIVSALFVVAETKATRRYKI